MVHYRRNQLPGGTYFFTVTLADRQSHALTENIEPLRAAFQRVMTTHPFEIVAMVVLPEHLHTIWALPPDDADYAGRWRAIKSGFTRDLIRAGIEFDAQRQRRIQPVATAILGTHSARRQRLGAACGLHSLQSGQARPRIARVGMATFIVSSLRAQRHVARRLGG